VNKPVGPAPIIRRSVSIMFMLFYDCKVTR
jgi:hypothetical protein